MKKFLALSLLLASTPSFAAELDVKCGTQMFSHLNARAVTTSRGLEVSISSSRLELPPLQDIFYHTIDLSSSWTPSALHIVIPSANLTEDQGVWKGEAKRKVVILDQPDPKGSLIQETRLMLWLSHDIANLGKNQNVISDVELSRARVEVSKDKISLTILPLLGNGESTISVDCDTEEGALLSFPNALTQHLNKAQK